MGLLSRWTSKWMPRGGSNKQDKKTGATRATLNDIQGALYVLLIGIIISTLVLLVENSIM